MTPISCPICHQKFTNNQGLQQHTKAGKCNLPPPRAPVSVSTAPLETRAKAMRSSILLDQAHWRYDAGISHNNVTRVLNDNARHVEEALHAYAEHVEEIFSAHGVDGGHVREQLRSSVKVLLEGSAVPHDGRTRDAEARKMVNPVSACDPRCVGDDDEGE